MGETIAFPSRSDIFDILTFRGDISTQVYHYTPEDIKRFFLLNVRHIRDQDTLLAGNFLK